MSVEAHMLSSFKNTMRFEVRLSGEDEVRFRRMMNVINDAKREEETRASFSLAMKHVLDISGDAVDLIYKNKNKLY